MWPFDASGGGGGNFHLKVEGAKSSGNAGDPMLGVAVSGGSNLITQTARWEVVKICASPKRPFFIIILLFLPQQYQFYQTLPYLTDRLT